MGIVKDLYCVVPAYQQEIRIKDFTPAAGATARILGSVKKIVLKKAGADCVIDLSGMRPGDVPAELFVVKLAGAL